MASFHLLRMISSFTVLLYNESNLPNVCILFMTDIRLLYLIHTDSIRSHMDEEGRILPEKQYY